ncbi:MAG: hypothetical protein EBY17_14910 [Acidobacteriia bacterium]|nr:hypothetical protein [Terriglobia bacterium]
MNLFLSGGGLSGRRSGRQSMRRNNIKRIRRPRHGSYPEQDFKVARRALRVDSVSTQRACQLRHVRNKLARSLGALGVGAGHQQHSSTLVRIPDKRDDCEGISGIPSTRGRDIAWQLSL